MCKYKCKFVLRMCIVNKMGLIRNPVVNKYKVLVLFSILYSLISDFVWNPAPRLLLLNCDCIKGTFIKTFLSLLRYDCSLFISALISFFLTYVLEEI